MILSSQSSVKINSSNPPLFNFSFNSPVFLWVHQSRIQVYPTCLILSIWKPVQKWPQKGSKPMYPTTTTTTNQHTHTRQHSKTKNLSQTNSSWHFWAKMLQYSTPVRPNTKYILQLLFPQFKYFQIRQLENFRAKRRTPFARNFSHFKNRKESEA